MAGDGERIDPTDVAGLNERARAWAAPGESIRPIGMERVVIEEDGLDALVEVASQAGAEGPVLVVWDHARMERGGEPLKPVLEERLARCGRMTFRALPEEPAAEYHPDDAAAERLAAEMEGFAGVVAVGSGSITDVVKYACVLAERKRGRRLRLILYPTAASVTAYTSAIAVLMRDGCKRNFAARLPEAIVCDLRTLADAPAAMTAAGFADVLARSVAYGDWFLAGQLGMDDRYSEVPGRILEPAEQRMIDAAGAIAAKDLEGMRALTEALLLAGVCMSVIDHTAPISGWEHVISHYLDMTAERDGRVMALHGGQVGVGTLISARAYDRAWGELDLDRIAAEVDGGSASASHRMIEAVFGPGDASGRMVGELRREFDQKLERWAASRAARVTFAERARAGALDAPLKKLLRSSAEIERALRSVGAPLRFGGLDRPIPRAAGAEAVRYGHLVRSRFTWGDLLVQAGWLTEARITDLAAGAA